MNYYAGLAAIIVLGLISVFWARSHYQSNSTATTSASASPAVGTTSFAGLAFDVCGTLAPSLVASSPASSAALTAQANGVVKLAPRVSADAGKNATVALFASGYPGLTITSNALKLPANGSAPAVNVANGEVCPAGTPDAGKKGTILISYWTNFATASAQTTTDPTAQHFTGNSLITVSFLPSGVHAIKPSTTTIQAMLKASAANTSTSTPTTGTSITSVPSTPTTAKK